MVTYMKNNNFYLNYFNQVKNISSLIKFEDLDLIIKELKKLKKNKGRLFFIGLGGSAGNCSHAVNDFRKLCSIESYAITDNVSELTARINDDGWLSIFSEWLKISKLKSNDAIFVLSVGGGNKEKKVSENIIEAIKLAKLKKAKVFGIVGRDGGYAKKNGDYVLLIPNTDPKLVTPLTESFQSILWHCIVSSPELQDKKTKW